MKDGPTRYGFGMVLVALGLLVAGPFLIVWAMNIPFWIGHRLYVADVGGYGHPTWCGQDDC